MKHQFPKPDEICELMQFKRAEFDAKKRRPVSALRIYDLRDIARRRTPRAAFDYADGAAERELSLARARQTFEGIQFHPQFLRDVSHVDSSATIFGGPAALPFGIAPTGFTRLVQTEGELAGTGATAAGIPFTHSTLASISIEDVRAANPDGRGWFQTRPRPCSPPTTGAPSALTGQSAPGGERHARRLRRLRTGRRAGLPLTVVAYDTSKLGRRAAELILERAEERKRGTSSPARRIVVPTTLITSGAER